MRFVTRRRMYARPTLVAQGVALSLTMLAAATPAAQTSAPAPAVATPAATPATPTAAAVKPGDEGIPVTSDLVLAKCGTCHRPDDKKRMSRISFIRSSPENWENTIKRMVTINNLHLEPTEARTILKYLADNHGLAPEEAKPAAFEAERRPNDFTYTADRETAIVCSSCHSIGRVMSERRTSQEWELLLNMHRGYYPLVDGQPMNDGQGFRRTRTAPEATDGRPADTRHPMERVVAHLAKAYPLRTPEWAAWTASVQPPALAGKWAVSGYVVGKGPIVGQVTIAADSTSPDGFTTDVRYTFVRSGESVARKGKSVVYGGFQWRGRGAQGDDMWREVMAVDRTRRSMEGRWFTGAYDETGIDVKLVRLAADPVVLGASVASLKTGAARAGVKIYGANFPARPTAKDVSLGNGVTISRIVAATPEVLTVDLDVAADAKPGPRDITVANVVQPAAVMLYHSIDGIKVMPKAGLARLGGVVFPKQVQQFEAVAFTSGPDGRPNTADDWELGLVDASWMLEEYSATFGDDDIKYVGALDKKTGLFTPGVDGPNAERAGSRNNVGDVWVVADVAADPALGLSKPMRARSNLIVTVPVYQRWYTGMDATPSGGTQ